MKRATKLRLYPTRDQEQTLAVQFGHVRFVWNRALEIKAAAWKERKESVSIHTLITMLPVWKDGECPWLQDADSQALQQTLRHLDRAYVNFFEKRAQYPRPKRKHAPRQSFAYPQRVKIDGSMIYLPKVGWVKAVVHREIEGTIKTVTISKESTGKYYASVLTEDGRAQTEPMRHLDLDKVTGIDLGLKDAVISSDGAKTTNPRFLRRALRNLRRKQQNLSCKVEAAKTRCAGDGKPIARLHDYFGTHVARARRQVARAHEQVRFSRLNWQHQLSRQLADDNQAVCAEDLNVKGMLKNRKLSRSISDVGWSGLLSKLDYKLHDRGGYLVKIDRFHPSTKTCSGCGARNEALTLKDRHWVCGACGATHDRDVNAAVNIRNQGILKLKAEGLSVSAHGGCVCPPRTVAATACEVGSSAL